MRKLYRFLVRVGALASKETIHIRRDVRTLYMALGLPVVLLLLFGFGVSFDIDSIPLAVVDHDRTRASLELRRTFVASDDFRLVALLDDAEDAEPLFQRGRVMALLVIPPGYERAVAHGETVTVQLVLDGTDANTANMARGKAEGMALGVNLEIVRAATSGVVAGAPLGASIWTRFNPEGRSALFLVPGLIAYILAIVAVLLTSLTVAREWERGSMEQLFATPVGRLEIILGKLLPYLCIGLVAVLMVLTVGAWVFDVPVRGDLTVLAIGSFLFLIGMLGLGLLISVLTRNQLVATQAAFLSSMLPTLLLSNFIFPVENMPTILQWLSRIIPARYYIEVLRGVLLRGNGYAELWPDLLVLLGFSALMITVSAARFTRRLA
jgi:ABC-2 type transport system permease protein